MNKNAMRQRDTGGSSGGRCVGVNKSATRCVRVVAAPKRRRLHRNGGGRGGSGAKPEPIPKRPLPMNVACVRDVTPTSFVLLMGEEWYEVRHDNGVITGGTRLLNGTHMERHEVRATAVRTASVERLQAQLRAAQREPPPCDHKGDGANDGDDRGCGKCGMSWAAVARQPTPPPLIDSLADALEYAKRLAYGRDIPTQSTLDHWDALLSLHATHVRLRDTRRPERCE